ncbi:undecaprenyl-diphosphate phosphatase [Candidatus Falkowbacteria bacterium]|jgi:undecaprenyl-diphosphatase|nr:undecaprenyl-diphosphate phosphatase [Candidatus Falkowbacteria bacterium]MBT4433502.1 undecaprenyl-diphosphate phosphatase [Candidatus Falkowbacteria bacterium]
MDYFNAIIFGVVQGITEFVPISSSGHLVILHRIIDLPIQNELAFDVILHFASLLAVILFFKKEILGLINNTKFLLLILLSTIPAGLIGFFLKDFIESSLRSPLVIAFTLFFGGVLFLIFEKIGKKTYNTDKLNWKNVLVVGFAQALALVPGTSRSGITITAGLGIGLKRETAVRFSFLMSIPIILGASLVKIPELEFNSLQKQEIYILLIAFAFSFLSAFLAIKYFIKFTKNHSLNIFAMYRFILAFIILIFMV